MKHSTKTVQGCKQKDGVTLPYVLNGLNCLIVTTIMYAWFVYNGLIDTVDMVNEALPIVTTLQIASFVGAALILIRSRVKNLGKQHKSIITDYFLDK